MLHKLRAIQVCMGIARIGKFHDSFSRKYDAMHDIVLAFLESRRNRTYAIRLFQQTWRQDHTSPRFQLALLELRIKRKRKRAALVICRALTNWYRSGALAKRS